MSKLVRDRIPVVIEESGKHAIYHVAEHSKHKQYFIEKLREETEELIAELDKGNDCTKIVEECADVYEVLINIIVRAGWYNAEYAIKEVALNKRNSRGSFKDMIILDKIEEYNNK